MSNTERTPVIGGSENIKLRGDSVVIREFEIVSKDLVDHLASHDDIDFAFRELVEVALKVKALATSTVAGQEIKNKVESLIEQLNSTYKAMVQDLKTEASKLTDAEDGAVTKAIQEFADGTLERMLKPEDVEGTPSPINRLKRAIIDEVSDYADNVEGSLDAIKIKLGIGVEKRKVSFDGTDFENNVALIVQNFGRLYGDEVEPTGSKSEVGLSKKGDVLVTLNKEDTMRQSCSVIWEAKTDAKFKGSAKTKSRRVSLDLVRQELDDALANRNAQSGVFVIDSDELDMNAQAPWIELDGNKLIVVVDRLDISEETIQLAYLWSRWKAKSSIGNFEIKIDTEGIQRSIETIRVQIKNLSMILSHQTQAKNSIDKAADVLNGFRRSVKTTMTDLAAMINVELDPANEDTGDDGNLSQKL